MLAIGIAVFLRLVVCFSICINPEAVYSLYVGIAPWSLIMSTRFLLHLSVLPLGIQLKPTETGLILCIEQKINEDGWLCSSE